MARDSARAAADWGKAFEMKPLKIEADGYFHIGNGVYVKRNDGKPFRDEYGVVEFYARMNSGYAKIMMTDLKIVEQKGLLRFLQAMNETK